MGWCVEILARRAISWALMREARRRILRVSTMAAAQRDVIVEADLLLRDFQQTFGPVHVGAGGHGLVRLVPASARSIGVERPATIPWQFVS